MASTALEGLLSPSRQIGKYFGLVSGLTSLLPVAVVFALVGSGAPEHRPSVTALSDTVSSVGFVEALVLTALGLLLGLVLHPLQFALTQVLEGYWGASSLSRRAMARSSLRHLDVWYRLSGLSKSGSDEIERIDDDYRPLADQLASKTLSAGATNELRQRERHLIERRLVASIDAQEANRALAKYPGSAAHVMPTRLGNVLRRFETESTEMFGLDPVSALPYVGLLADSASRDYLDDQRSGMDLAVRLTLVWALSTAASTAILWRYDVWLLVPLVGYTLMCLSYRGAVASAMHYGSAITVVMTLNRSALYDRLRLEDPQDTEEERRRNLELNRLLSGFPSLVAFTRRSPERAASVRK